jgi:hypothetical protein
MKKAYFIIVLLHITSNVTLSQEFSSKEIKRIQPVLNRSSSSIRGFDKNSMISVESLSNNALEGFVETALFNAGFNVVSNKVARESIKVANPLSPKNDTIDVTRVTEYKSVYLVTLNGTFRPNIGRCTEALSGFSARVVDLANEGKLVATFNFTGNSFSYYACMEDAAVAFAYRLLNPEKK